MSEQDQGQSALGAGEASSLPRLLSVDLTAANDAINAAAHSGLPAAAAPESNFARRNA